MKQGKKERVREKKKEMGGWVNAHDTGNAPKVWRDGGRARHI